MQSCSGFEAATRDSSIMLLSGVMTWHCIHRARRLLVCACICNGHHIVEHFAVKIED